MTEGRGNLPPTDPEIWSLVEAIVDGTITPGERDRLEARLRSEPQARLFYVAYLDLHAHLQWRTRGESVQTPAKVQASPGGKERKSERNPGYPHWSQTGWGTLRWFGSLSRPALAACLLLAAGLVIGLLVPPHASDEGESPDFPDAPAGSVAVLIDDKNTVWEKDMALPHRIGFGPASGTAETKSGGGSTCVPRRWGGSAGRTGRLRCQRGGPRVPPPRQADAGRTLKRGNGGRADFSERAVEECFEASKKTVDGRLFFVPFKWPVEDL